MATWSTVGAAALAAPQQIQLATRRRDGTLRATRTIWIVADRLHDDGPRSATLEVHPA